MRTRGIPVSTFALMRVYPRLNAIRAGWETCSTHGGYFAGVATTAVAGGAGRAFSAVSLATTVLRSALTSAACFAAAAAASIAFVISGVGFISATALSAAAFSVVA